LGVLPPTGVSYQAGLERRWHSLAHYEEMDNLHGPKKKQQELHPKSALSHRRGHDIVGT